MQQLHVLIVGAGIGGLTTALALQRAGIRVSVYEQAPALAEVGAGLTLASNATLILQHLGLGAVLEDLGVVPGRGAVKHYRTGRTLVDIPRGTTQVERFGAPYCQIHRHDLHQALVAAVRSADRDCLHLGCTLEDFGQDDSGVTALFANGQTARGDLLIGCDGIRSTVRARLFGIEDPRFTGYVAWRGLVPMERLAASMRGAGLGGLDRPRTFPDPLQDPPRRTAELHRHRADQQLGGGRLVGALDGGGPACPNSATSSPPPGRSSWRRRPTSASSGESSTGIRCRPGPRAASPCSATRPTRPRPSSARARRWRWKMRWCSRGPSPRPASVPEALARYEQARVARANGVLLASRENGINLTTTDPDRYDEDDAPERGVAGPGQLQRGDRAGHESQATCCPARSTSSAMFTASSRPCRPSSTGSATGQTARTRTSAT